MSNAEGPVVDGQRLPRLKELLQAIPWRDFELMVPRLVGHLLDLRFSAARSGFQEGADAGSVGRDGRRLRIEAKRYSSDFDARDILGGLRQAISRDPLIEAWIAAATRDIPEQLANALEAEGARDGVPVLSIDWPDDPEPTLAALCTASPTIVAQFAGEEAGLLASELEAPLAGARERLQRELEEWNIGFERLRRLTQDRLADLWRSRRVALSKFGQDVAGGDGRPFIRRAGVSDALDIWWAGRSAVDAPAAVLGQGGVGKTWATLAWLEERSGELPIVITIPAGAVTGSTGASVQDILNLLGDRLADITGVQHARHWARRLDRLLKRPPEEGPVVCVVVDGINQNPDIRWMSILQILQDEPFSGRVRVIVTTRPQDFENSLGRLRRLAEAAEPIMVERFGSEPGGELDQMLGAHGLARADLHEDLVELARVPRLFGLILRLRDRLADAGRITTHRLLWEYGRDVFGDRAGISFSEEEWREWLREIARRERVGLRPRTLAALSETAARPDLGSPEVAARLSDIIDGNFTVAAMRGVPQLSAEIVAHAVGAALLEWLDEIARAGDVAVEAQLNEWLDPISGLEERAEVLRAATSIMAERDAPAAPEVAGAVVTAWLQTQNLPPRHRSEIRRLAPMQVQPLLEAVERSEEGPQAAARELALDALRSVPSDDPITYGLIIATCVRWLSRVSRDVSPRFEGREQVEASRTARLHNRIGHDESGPMTVLGVPLVFEDDRDDRLDRAVPTVLDGRPLAGAMEVFLRAALATAIRVRFSLWDDLKWLCLLNEVDPQETAARLRLLSVELRSRPAEEGINPALSARSAALLLWLTGMEEDEEAAWELDPGIDHQFNYERDYLSNPGDSFFRLERRHAVATLADRRLPLRRRCGRARDFLLDPIFELPHEFVEDVRAAGEAFDMSTLDVGRYRSSEDIDFEEIEPAIARCAPDLLAQMHRRKLAGYGQRPTSSFDSAAWSASEAIMLADPAAAEGCRLLRERATPEGAGLNSSSPSSLLMAEVIGLPGREQVSVVLDADPEFISVEFEHVLRPLTSDDVDTLLAGSDGAPPRRTRNLICLLSTTAVDALSDLAWSSIEGLALKPTFDARACAFELLQRVDAERFGGRLLQENWSWNSEEHDLCRHYGSLAVAAAGLALPFEEIAPRVAPALLPRVVAMRGTAPSEATLAAAILDSVVVQASVEPPDPGSAITINAEKRRQHPMLVSITPGPMEGEEDDPFASLRRAANEDASRQHTRRAVETAVERILQARTAGASLYLSSIAADDLGAIISASPDLIRRWTEGMIERSRDFRRRVHLAEGFYLALCEALLRSRHTVGAQLWRALRDGLYTRYIGLGGVSELVLMLFRLPTDETVASLREELLRLEFADTDERLLDLAVAAAAYGCEPWLANAADRDRSSDLAWRRRRANIIDGFSTGATLPVPNADPEGPHISLTDDRSAKAARRKARDAAARHWWRLFVQSQDEAEAFAAWTLFMRAVDRRALAWLRSEAWPDLFDGELSRRKLVQVTLNERELVQKAESREKDGASNLFDKSISDNISPWYRGRAGG